MTDQENKTGWKKFKCIYCESDIQIPLPALIEALNEGKSVMECEHCNKSLTIRSDDGDSVYIN